MSEGNEKRPSISVKQEAAEDAFCEYLRVRTAGASDFEAFCSKYPDLQTELCELHDQWSRVHLILERLGGSISIAERLKSRFGEIDPGISLHEDSGDPDGNASIRLLDKLAAKRPASTRYDIRGELGRGGMGIVYKVWDENLRRQLAMKVVLGKRDASGKTTQIQVEPRRMSRFLEEAQITGQLDHPGILPVHELGIDPDGRVFFTMRLVEGRELRELFGLVRKGEGEWSRTRVLGILLRVCEAMAFAHSKGVIHRDLKPANIMVGRFGAVYVMDWGLAKVLGREDSHDIRLREDPKDPSSDEIPTGESVATDRSDSSSKEHEALVTMDGDIVGTPSYMSPEQASGHLDELGPRADVYSTGAMLYELLTGQMPYEPLGERIPAHTILNAVRTSAPWPVLDIAPDTPPELVAICEKAMARNVDDRYADMSDFASDLRAYLEGHVVTAYETGVTAEVKKWMERNKAASLVGVALILVIVSSIAAFIWQQQDTVEKLQTEKNATADARDDALKNLTLAQQRERELLDEKDKTEEAIREAKANLEQANRNREEADRQTNAARRNAQQAQNQSREARRQSYLAGLVAADYSLRLGEVKDAKRSLAACERTMRGWEWEYLAAQSDTSLATFGEISSNLFFAEFVGEDDMVSVAQDFKIRLTNLESGRINRQMTSLSASVMQPSERAPSAFAAAIHPEGRFLAVATYNSVVGLWDLAAPRSQLDPVPIRTYVGHEEDRTIRSITISPDGSYLASGSGDQTIRIYDFESGETLAVLRDLEDPARKLKFSPVDPSWIAAASSDGTVRVWNWRNRDEPLLLRGHIGTVNDLAWRDDGAQLATVSDDGTLRIWNPVNGRNLSTFTEHTEGVTAVDYAKTSAGHRIVTGSRDTTLRVWDPTIGRVERVFAGHEESVRSVRFDSRGERLLSSSNDGTVRLWSMVASQGVESLNLTSGVMQTRVLQGTFDENGDRLLSAIEHASLDDLSGVLRSSGEARVWNRKTREVICTYETEAKLVSAVFVDKGHSFAALLAPSVQSFAIGIPALTGAVEIKTVRLVVVDATTGEYLRDLPVAQNRELFALAANREGSLVAVAGLDQTILVIEVATGRIVHELKGHRRSVHALAFSADGRLLASGSRDKTVRVWSLETGEELRSLLGHQWQVNTLAFDRQGVRLVSGSNDRTARIWDLESGTMVQELSGHDGAVFGLTFTPSGRRVLTAAADNFVRVYDTDSGQALLRMHGHSGSVRGVSISPDGATMLSSSYDGTHRLWESRSARDRAADRR